MKNSEEKLLKKIREYYHQEQFSGCGALTFQAKLALEKNLKVPLKLVYKALQGRNLY